MLPITGPFTRPILHLAGPPLPDGSAPTWYEGEFTYFRQRKPYDLPLALFMSKVYVVRGSSHPNPWLQVDIGDAQRVDVSLRDASFAKAYSKLVEDIGDASLWAVNVAEYRQSVDLIAKDGVTLTRFARALHKFDFVGAARILKTRKPSGLKETAKAFGNNFLKYHFGWEPLVKDIGAAVSTLQNPIPPKKVKGRARVVHVDNYHNDYGVTFARQESKCKVQCEIQVTNPNLYLASQLGFVNPLAIGWELVPFSFVVDWFVNVGQFLGQMTDFAGLQVLKPQTTYYDVRDSVMPPRSYYKNGTFRHVLLQRLQSLPSVSLHIRPWKGVSPVRAATAISLLVQQLR